MILSAGFEFSLSSQRCTLTLDSAEYGCTSLRTLTVAAPGRLAALPVRVKDDEIEFGGLCTIGFERTLCVPADGRKYPLPPGLGTFQIHDLSGCANLPAGWKRRGALAIVLARCEALWICFSARWWHPCAVKLGLGGVNILTGHRWRNGLSGARQDYLACPAQPWLEAYCPAPGEMAQFVAPPMNDASEANVDPAHVDAHDLRIAVYPPRAGRFDETPPTEVRDPFVLGRPCELRLGRGEDLHRRICPDPHGRETWDESAPTEVRLHLLNPATFHAITGTPPPLTPISRQDYESLGVPWLKEYGEDCAS
jgi:hypothetical protein